MQHLSPFGVSDEAVSAKEGVSDPADGGAPLWGRVCSANINLRFRADMRASVVTFGRSSTCNSVLPCYRWISGVHFVVTRTASGDAEDGEVRVHDKSRFGTWLNGAKIGNGNCMLARDGDIIGLRAPRVGAETKHDTISLVLRILSGKEVASSSRLRTLMMSKLSMTYSIVSTLGEFVFPSRVFSLRIYIIVAVQGAVQRCVRGR